MRRIGFSPQAQDDLREIFDYIAVENRRAAHRLVERIHLKLGELAEFPGVGHRRADVKDRTYRFFTVKPYVLAYRFDEGSLTLVRVIHGRRDFRAGYRRDEVNAKPCVEQVTRAGEMVRVARAKGLKLMREDGWTKGRKGVTTVEEVHRVTRLDARAQ
jgi:addiction module RelE/StbE family toxin